MRCVLTLLLAITVVSSVGGCDFSDRPEPGTQASVSGTLTYFGAPPACEGGRVAGLLVFQLFEGTGSDLLLGAQPPQASKTLAPTRLFREADCAETLPVRREGAFELTSFGPRGASSTGRQMRLVAWYDRDGAFEREEHGDEDGFRDQPRRGDVWGAAYASATSRQFDLLAYEPSSRFPEGQKIQGVAVTLDAEVRSEPPYFRLSGTTQPLSSEALLPDDTDRALWESELFTLTEAQLQVLPSNDVYRTAFAMAGLAVSDDPPRGLWSLEMDPAHMGSIPRHPTVGYLDIRWRTPFTVFRRIRSSAEETTNVPNVYLVPLPRPSLATKEVYSPTMDLLVPPIAIVDLNPDVPVCRIPIIAPGNLADEYERESMTECQELPTGTYEIYIQHGVAGGTASTGAPANISENGLRVLGGEFVSQRWRVPNEALANFASDQSLAGTFRVVETDPDTAPDAAAMTYGHGVAACEEAPDPVDPTMTRPIDTPPLPPACCDQVEHLCGIPLCPVDMSGSSATRAATMVVDGKPNCMPFLVPASCCGT